MPKISKLSFKKTAVKAKKSATSIQKPAKIIKKIIDTKKKNKSTY